MIVLGAVLPHPPILLAEIGRGREAAASATLDAYAQIATRLRELSVRRVLLISTHGIVTLNRFHALQADISGDFGRFGEPKLAFARSTDRELVTALLDAGQRRDVPLSAVSTWETSDHSIGVPIRLLADALPESIAVLSVSFRSAADHFRCGEVLGKALAGFDEPTAVLASGDGVHTLSERSPERRHPRGPEVQAAIESALADWEHEALIGLDESLRRDVDESVVSPALMLMGALGGGRGVRGVRARILAAEAPWGVGYVTAIVERGSE